MPAFAAVLADAETAAVVTFVRASRGHHASAVGPADVKGNSSPAAGDSFPSLAEVRFLQ